MRRHYASSPTDLSCPRDLANELSISRMGSNRLFYLAAARVCVCICMRVPYALMLVVVVLSFFFESLTGSSVPIMRDGC